MQPVLLLLLRWRRAATTLALAAAFLTSSVRAEDFQVSPDGKPHSIAEALDLAGPGDTLVLSDGVYSDPVVTVRSGEEGSPITITGGSGAVVSGAFDDRVSLNTAATAVAGSVAGDLHTLRGAR